MAKCKILSTVNKPAAGDFTVHLRPSPLCQPPCSNSPQLAQGPPSLLQSLSPVKAIQFPSSTSPDTSIATSASYLQGFSISYLVHISSRCVTHSSINSDLHKSAHAGPSTSSRLLTTTFRIPRGWLTALFHTPQSSHTGLLTVTTTGQLQVH